jgi:hypothetical protein
MIYVVKISTVLETELKEHHPEPVKQEMEPNSDPAEQKMEFYSEEHHSAPAQQNKEAKPHSKPVKSTKVETTIVKPTIENLMLPKQLMSPKQLISYPDATKTVYVGSHTSIEGIINQLLWGPSPLEDQSNDHEKDHCKPKPTPQPTRTPNIRSNPLPTQKPTIDNPPVEPIPQLLITTSEVSRIKI